MWVKEVRFNKGQVTLKLYLEAESSYVSGVGNSWHADANLIYAYAGPKPF